jgi:pyruvate-ferredoxin/flavodoxin oxidoreductase
VAEQLWKDAADLQKRYDFLAQLAGKAEKSPSEAKVIFHPAAIKKART